MSKKYIIAAVIPLALLASYIILSPKEEHTHGPTPSGTSLEGYEASPDDRKDNTEIVERSISPNSSIEPKTPIKERTEGDNEESRSPEELEPNSISHKLVQYSGDNEDGSETAYMNLGEARSLGDVGFSKLLNELSYSNTEASAEHKYKYNTEISEVLKDTNITIIGLECNDTICAASLNYDHSTLDEVEEKINNANLDTSALIFAGNDVTNGTRSANIVLSAGKAIAGFRVSTKENENTNKH